MITGAVPDARPAALAVPTSHRDLLDRPLAGMLTTHLANGRLQTSVVWYWPDGDDVLVSTMAEFFKARNLRARPLATLLVVGPDGRWVELRATVREETDADATAALDAVGVRYTGVAPYFGAVVPAHLAEVEHPVTFRLVPTSVATGPRPPTAPADPGATADLSAPADPGAPVGPAGRPALAGGPATEPGLAIPATHLGLIDGPNVAALSTRLPDGAARTQPVGCARDGDVLLVPTTAGSPVARDLRADPRATLLVLDPGDGCRWIEVRADAELIRTGADVLVRLHARRVICDAIHP